jgi:hypothetical protein
LLGGCARQPHLPVSVIANQLQIIGSVHLPRPYDFGTIDVSPVVDRFVQRIMSVAVADGPVLISASQVRRYFETRSIS